MNCSMKEAEEVKTRLDLRCQPEDEDVVLYRKSPEAGGRKFTKLELSQIVQREIYQLNNEIGALLLAQDWFTLQNNFPKNRLPGGIVLTGGTALLMGITEYLQGLIPGPWAYSFHARLGHSRYDGDGCIGLNSPKESVVMGMIAYEAHRFKLGEDDDTVDDADDSSWLAKIKRGVVEFFIGQY